MNRLKLLLLWSPRFCGVLNKEFCIPSHKFVGKKNLFTPSSLKITAFSQSKENTLKSIPNSDAFKSKMDKNCDTSTNYLVFSEDLKKMIRLAESDEDLLILQKMLEKFNSQNDTIKFHAFYFGPEILRLYYVLNKPVEAIALLENEKLSSMFDNTTCYVLLSDLLFKNKMYEEIIRIFKKFSENQLQNRKYSSPLVKIYFAACYKLNTPEAYEEALKLWQSFLKIGYKVPYRCTWFFAMLALKQNHTYAALEAIAMKQRKSVIVDIKVMALSKEKRYDDALNELHQFLFTDKPKSEFSSFITNETIEFLEEEFKNSNVEQSKKFQKIKEELIGHNFLINESLDKFLCEEMEYLKKLQNETSHA